MRAIANTVIHIGSVEIPVRVYSQVKSKSSSSLKLVAPSGQPVKQILIDPETNKKVSKTNTRKGISVNGKFIIFEQDELEFLKSSSSPDIEFIEYVPSKDILDRYVEASYWLSTLDDDQTGTRDYLALQEALRGSQRAMMVWYAFRVKINLAAIVVEGSYLVLKKFYPHNRVINNCWSLGGITLDEKKLKAFQDHIIMNSHSEFDWNRYPRDRDEKIKQAALNKKLKIELQEI